jgi:2-polyprenyl-3-methyl-5-hydroxy-6-metoxy-1,4-benzoquinol methylase
MPINEDLNQYEPAYESDFKYNDENHAMLQWYASRLIEKASHSHTLDILSLGIGHQTVSLAIIDKLSSKLGRYVLIEGSQNIIENYIAEHQPGECVELVHSYFEEYVRNLADNLLFDIIEMGFVLEHVENPLYIMKQYRQLLKANGSIFIAVPNAKSLHRLIGHKAGLLEDLHQLSEHDLQLGHKRYFDLESIKELVLKAGLKIASIEGVFLKPITTDQIKKLNFSREIMGALYQIGQVYPEISNAILIEARQ